MAEFVNIALPKGRLGEKVYSMFEAAGHPYAMGNAIDKIKELAEKILPTNDEDGVAFAIEEILGGSL